MGDQMNVSSLHRTVFLAVAALLLMAAPAENTWLLLLGVGLFGAGIGNATSLPPLIAQSEFASQDVQRAVPMIVAAGQATYAFAPAAFGILRALDASDSTIFFAAVAGVQVLAIACFLLGRVNSARPD